MLFALLWVQALLAGFAKLGVGRIRLVIIIEVFVVLLLVLFFDHVQIILKRQRDNIFLDLLGQVELLLKFIFLLFLVIFLLILRLALLLLLLFVCEESENTFLLHLNLHVLSLFLLFDNFLRRIAALLPLNGCGHSFVRSTQVFHVDLFDQHIRLKIILLFKGEFQVIPKALLLGMVLELDVCQVSQNWPVFFADHSTHVWMVKQNSLPEISDTFGCVLDCLHIAHRSLSLPELGICFKLLSAGVELLHELLVNFICTVDQGRA